MTTITGLSLRDADPADFERIVQLNAAEVDKTSAMDAQRLQALDRLASYHKVAVAEGQVVAFLLAMDDTAGYDNDNFRWFSARYPRFLYIDRIVVDAALAGRGIGARLYRDLFAHAQGRGIGTIVCEYDIEPLNPASRAFHVRFGFREAGTRHIAGSGKRVSLQALDLTAPAPTTTILPGNTA